MANGSISRRSRRTRTVGTTGAARRARRASAETALARIEEDALASPIDLRAVRGRRLTRVVRITGGWVILGVGLVSLILPVLPGIPLVILAVFMLAPGVPVFARVVAWSKSHVSRITTGIRDVNARFAEDFHRRFTS